LNFNGIDAGAASNAASAVPLLIEAAALARIRDIHRFSRMTQDRCGGVPQSGSAGSGELIVTHGVQANKKARRAL